MDGGTQKHIPGISNKQLKPNLLFVRSCAMSTHLALQLISRWDVYTLHTDCSARNWHTKHAANMGNELDAVANYIWELIFFRLRSPFLYCIRFGVRSGAKCSPPILTTNNDDTNLMRCLCTSGRDNVWETERHRRVLDDNDDSRFSTMLRTTKNTPQMGFSDERHTVAGRRQRKRHFSLSLYPIRYTHIIYPTTWGITFCHVMSVVSMLLSLKSDEMVLLSLLRGAKWENIVELGAVYERCECRSFVVAHIGRRGDILGGNLPMRNQYEALVG